VSGIEVVSRTQRIIVNPPSSVSVSLRGSDQQSINARPNASVSIVNAGPIGPEGAQGIQGPQGRSGTGTETYIHNQMTPASEWIIVHSMGSYPSVTIVDSAGTVVVGDVVYTSSEELRVLFNSAFSGQAYLN
jgi:hypothetical protein